MEENKLTHRAGLVREAAEILNRYTPYAAERRVTFQTAENGWLTARLERTDGQPLAQSANPIDQKLAHLKDQTLVIRPFFLPMAKSPWEESDANDFTQVNFDYAAILGYGVTPEGTSFMKALYFLPTDALLAGQKPRPDGTWHLPLATYYVHQISLDPRKKFARFLYLVERITEALEYQYDKTGGFFSNPAAQLQPVSPARQRGRRVSVSCIFFPKFSLEMVAMYAKIRYTIPTTAGERSLSRPREI